MTIEGTAASGITATLSSGATTTTGSGGSFAFSGVEAGTYTVTISGFPEDATFAQVTQSATIATDGQNVQLNFAGEYIRSSSVVGSVVAADAVMSGGDGQPETLAGVTVTLGGEHAMGETMETDETGGFMFTGLRAGTYTVTISNFPEDVSFETVSVEVEVDVGDVGSADFTGHYIRTSAVEGQVIIEGEGLAGVTVTLNGGPADESYTARTDADGGYRFEDLRPGDYTVSISDFDTRDYEFAATSQDVSVDLDETGTVSFTGVLLRTSGISGRVSVEGMGLADIAVTLSGGDESRATTTDDGGQYAFAGLAAGDYTVTIAVESAAYVFESMSQDKTVGDDESAIVNFEGAHARTASVSGMLFLDEASKDDAYNEGEDAFPAPFILQALQTAGVTLPPQVPAPITLVGPGVNDFTPGSLNLATGGFSFSGLVAGNYELRVGSLTSLLSALPAEAAAVLRDFEYGGPAAGYDLEVEVGQAVEQNIPVDITHTTVHFAVTLRAGETPGMPVPGATVTLSSGESGTTGDNGVASIRFARAGTEGNMVSATVAVDGYHVADGATPVMWDPKSPYTQTANANDILNLGVSFSFKGATVTRGDNGGEPLGGWAVSVTSGGSAVAGAPTALEADGSASFSETVGADDLPKSYAINVADDQTGKDAEGNELDGGENYTADDPLTHVHTGLTLAGAAADAGTLVVRYTTQTLMVYVHEENDQVRGYSGNVLGDDVRMSGMLDVEVQYVENGYRHRFAAADSVRSSNKGGVYTFSNVPADKNVMATATKASDTLDIIVLENDEVAAYTDVGPNPDNYASGIMGGAFGAQGGWGHTVELCPLTSHEGQQRHDECSTFAFVHTYAVDGQAWKNEVKTSGDDFAMDVDGSPKVTKTGQPGLSVSLNPVENENLAGTDESFTAEKAGDMAFDFGQMASGVYTVTVSDANWTAQRGPDDGPTDDLADRLEPLDSALNIDVTPTTGYVFGTVSDNKGLRAPGVSVDVNGVTVTTDGEGRYVAEGFGAANYTKPGATVAQKNRSIVRANDPGQGDMAVVGNVAFAANTPTRVDFTVAQATDIAYVSGRVVHSGTGAGVEGVEIMVEYGAGTGAVAPLNATDHVVNKKVVRMLKTDADGNYTAHVKATGENVYVSAKKKFMFFTPAQHTITAAVGASVSGINFSAFDSGTITGRVVDKDDATQPLSGVIVSATADGATSAAHADTTGATGTYVLRVPYGTYSVTATKNGYINFSSLSGVTVPNDGTPRDNITAEADDTNADLSGLHLSGVSFTDAAGKAVKFAHGVTSYTATVANSVAMTTVTATPAVAGASASIDPSDASSSAGHQVELEVGSNLITVTVTAENTTDTKEYDVTVTRRAVSTMIEGTITDGNGDGIGGVTITVGGETPLNATGTPKALKTKADGSYAAEVESTGASATVTPTKKGLTFTPASRSVTLTANATIAGIDFVGSGNATITGRVVDSGGNGLRGAVVTASPRGGSGGPDATTRASGTFTIRDIPLGWTTITVAKDGYSFAPRDVLLTGGTVNVGNLTAAGTIQPASVEVVRDPVSTTDNAFDGTMTVNWSAGAAATKTTTSYTVQYCVVDASETAPAGTCASNDPDWVSNTVGSVAVVDATETQTLQVAANVSVANGGGFKIRVVAADTRTTGETAVTTPLSSAVVDVSAIDVAPSNFTAKRNTTGTDRIEVRWDGQWQTGSNASSGRVIAGFMDQGVKKWVTLFTIDRDAGGADSDHKEEWNIVVVDGVTTVDPADGTSVANDPATTGVDESQLIDVTSLTVAKLNGELEVRLQVRQEGVDQDPDDADTDVWQTSESVTIPAAGS